MKYGLTKVHCQGISGESVVNSFILVFFMWPIFQQFFGQTGLKSCRDLTTVITADGRFDGDQLTTLVELSNSL